MSVLDRFTQEFWDERYRSHDHLWSGRPNQQLVDSVQSLAPGRALDVGCGEGGDAIWLARRGWSVTGIDVSPVALERAQAHAREAGEQIAARTAWRAVDLFADEIEPLGIHDLVSSQFLHMPLAVRSQTMERLTGAVGPGGHLLLVSHHPSDLEIPGLRRPKARELFYTPEQLGVMLDASAWEIVRADAPTRAMTDRDGQTFRVRDTVLLARRRA